MASVTLADAASRKVRTVAKRWTPKKDFKPGGSKGKLHRRLHVPEGEKIPAERLEQAAHSKDPETKREAVRAQTMKAWHHDGPVRRSKMYSNTKG